MEVFSLRLIRNLSVILSSALWLSCSSEEIIVREPEQNASERAVKNDQGPQNGRSTKGQREAKFPVAPAPAPTPAPPQPLPPPPPPVVPIVELCGDTIISPSEECDDGNQHSGDGCSKLCDKELCGDGIVNNINENCDDKNSEDGDGCDKDCHTEIDFVKTNRSTLDVGNTHTCYKTDSFWRLKCWGSNNHGELGQGNTEEIGNGVDKDVKDVHSIRIGSGITTALVTAGGSDSSNFTCVATSVGTLKCFGDNSSGQLGQGDTTNLGDNEGEMGNHLPAISLAPNHTAQDVDAGGRHVCALLDNGSLKCFGNNAFGQLGLGDTNNRGDESGEMGINLPFVNLGTGRSTTYIAIGEDFSCAHLDNATLKCWGRNDKGQLGQGTTTSIGSGGNQMGDNLLAIDLGTGRSAFQVATGAKHTCVLLDNRKLKCFGNNDSGQLGQGNTNSLGDAPGEMGDNLAAVNLGAGRSVLQVVAGDNHTCALLDNHTVKCFGDNLSGQLGQGNQNDIGDNPFEMGDFLMPINLGAGRTAKIIAAGGETTCVVLDNDEVKCFGENAYGQLGQGNTRDIGNEPNEMGDNLHAIELGF